MREVSCIAVVSLLRECRRAGIAPERLVEGVPHSLGHLRSRRRWIDWSAFARICANGDALWTPEEQFDIGRRLNSVPDFRWHGVVGRALFDLEGLYRWINSATGPAGRIFRCVAIDVSKADHHRFTIRGALPPGYEPAPMYFRISAGALSQLPKVLGYPPARAELRLTATGGEVELSVDADTRRDGWLRRSLLRPLQAATVLAEAAKTAVEDFQDSEARYRKIFEHANESIFTLDNDGHVVDANPHACRELGYERSELVGRHVDSFVRGPRPFNPARLHQDRAVIVRAEHVRKDGTAYPVETRAIMMSDGGRPTIYAFARNVELQQRIEKVRRQVLEHTLEAQESERRRLARDLHDSTSQSLTSILLNLRALEQDLGATDKVVAEAVGERIEIIRATTHASLDDVQRLVQGLRPTVLDDLGFIAAVERLVEDYRCTHQLSIDYTRAGNGNDARVPIAAVSALYRIVQEALTNVVRHAGASRASVVIECRDDRVRIIVEDDGRGFDPNDSAEQGFGLIGMRERLSMLDGRLTIESSPNSGTAIYAEIPLPASLAN